MEWRYAVVAGSSTVLSDPAIVRGVYVNVSPTSDMTVSDGSTRIYVIPAGAAVGNFYDFDGVRFETSLVVNSQDGDVVVQYKELRGPHY